MNLDPVPCGECRLCCKMMTPLYPEHGDNPANYQTFVLQNPGRPPMVVLDRLTNGDCVYLAPGGCSIYESRPYICRSFDCRGTYKNSTRQGRKLAIKQGTMTKEIFERGKELLQKESKND